MGFKFCENIQWWTVLEKFIYILIEKWTHIVA